MAPHTSQHLSSSKSNAKVRQIRKDNANSGIRKANLYKYDISPLHLEVLVLNAAQNIPDPVVQEQMVRKLSRIPPSPRRFDFEKQLQLTLTQLQWQEAGEHFYYQEDESDSILQLPELVFNEDETTTSEDSGIQDDQDTPSCSKSTVPSTTLECLGLGDAFLVGDFVIPHANSCDNKENSCDNKENSCDNEENSCDNKENSCDNKENSCDNKENSCDNKENSCDNKENSCDNKENSCDNKENSCPAGNQSQGYHQQTSKDEDSDLSLSTLDDDLVWAMEYYNDQLATAMKWIDDQTSHAQSSSGSDVLHDDLLASALDLYWTDDQDTDVHPSSTGSPHDDQATPSTTGQGDSSSTLLNWPDNFVI